MQQPKLLFHGFTGTTYQYNTMGQTNQSYVPRPIRRRITAKRRIRFHMDKVRELETVHEAENEDDPPSTLVSNTLSEYPNDSKQLEIACDLMEITSPELAPDSSIISFADNVLPIDTSTPNTTTQYYKRPFDSADIHIEEEDAMPAVVKSSTYSYNHTSPQPEGFDANASHIHRNLSPLLDGPALGESTSPIQHITIPSFGSRPSNKNHIKFASYLFRLPRGKVWRREETMPLPSTTEPDELL